MAQGWRELVGDAGRSVSLEHFGASADYQKLYQEFGFTKENVAAVAAEPRRGRRRLIVAPTARSTSAIPSLRHQPQRWITMTDALARLSELGVSVWLDDLSRELLAGGELSGSSTSGTSSA